MRHTATPRYGQVSVQAQTLQRICRYFAEITQVTSVPDVYAYGQLGREAHAVFPTADLCSEVPGAGCRATYGNSVSAVCPTM